MATFPSHFAAFDNMAEEEDVDETLDDYGEQGNTILALKRQVNPSKCDSIERFRRFTDTTNKYFNS